MYQAFGMRIGPLLLLLAAIAVGVGIFVKTLLVGIVDSREAAFSLEAPGSLDITLDDAGGYTIFAEYFRTQDSQERARPGGLEWLEIAVTQGNSGTPVILETVPEDERSYAIRRQLQEPLYRLTADAPGTFQLSATYPPDEPGPPVNLLLSRDYGAQVVMACARGVGVLLATICVAGIIAAMGRAPVAAESRPAHSV